MTAASPPGIVAVPSLSWMWSQAVAAQYLAVGCAPPGSQLMFEPNEYASLALKRNVMVQAFLDGPPEFRWFCFLDSDMVPPPDTIARLLAWNQPIVSGLCYMRLPPYSACCGLEGGTAEITRQVTEPDPGSPALRQVDQIGAACLLVRREVLEQVAAPWFDHVTGWQGVGSDVYFCRKARAAGFPIYCDTSLVIPHLSVVGVDREFAQAWRAAHP